MLAHAVGHQELRVLGPTVRALGEPDLFLAERLAVRGGSVLPVGRAVADVAVEDDQRGPAFGAPERTQRVLDEIDVICVADPQHVPVVAHEPGRYVLGKRDLRAAFDRDVVVVVDPAQVVEAEMPRERRGLRTDALHQAAVAANGVDVIREHVEAGLVVSRREPLLRDRHADTGRDTLPERPGRGLDPGHEVVLGMPWRVAAELAEAPDVVQRDRGLADRLVVGVDGLNAGEMEHRPEQHRGVTVGEHEAIAVRPDRVLRIEPHHAVPQRERERRQRHRRAGMTGVGRLHRVDR